MSARKGCREASAQAVIVRGGRTVNARWSELFGSSLVGDRSYSIEDLGACSIGYYAELFLKYFHIQLLQQHAAGDVISCKIDFWF